MGQYQGPGQSEENKTSKADSTEALRTPKEFVFMKTLSWLQNTVTAKNQSQNQKEKKDKARYEWEGFNGKEKGEGGVWRKPLMDDLA